MESSMEKMEERFGLDHQADFKHTEWKMVCLMSALWECSVPSAFERWEIPSSAESLSTW